MNPWYGLALVTMLLLPFQNCSFVSSPRSFKAFDVQGSATEMSGGQPYDGKPFVKKEQCPDGTLIGTRVLMRSDEAILYRDNCQSLSPRPLSPSEYSSTVSGEVLYSDMLLEEEKPAIPLPGVVTWFLQLTGMLQSQPAGLYIVDMFGNDSVSIADLKNAGHTVICTISAGTVESWNPDANQFLASEVGNAVSGGPGERWLDTRSEHVRQMMLSRLDQAKAKGCQGVDLDAADGFVNNTGFPLTRTTQLEYNQTLAFAAHDRGLILTLNAVPELAPDLSNVFDIAVAEQCFKFNECSSYQAFTDKDKPVLVAEYGAFSSPLCEQAKILRLSLTFLSKNLDGSRYEPCP